MSTVQTTIISPVFRGIEAFLDSLWQDMVGTATRVVWTAVASGDRLVQVVQLCVVSLLTSVIKRRITNMAGLFEHRRRGSRS
jgi:ABC-type anion transport system duplicated permease subunit